MNPLDLPAHQIADTLTRLLWNFHGHLSRAECDALEETARRVRRLEALQRDVLPDLRRRLTADQAASHS